MNTDINRRGFIGGMLAAGSAPLVFSGCVTKYLANSKVNVGIIGLGRIAFGMDIPLTIKHTGHCRITAVCDLDRKRLDNGAKFVQEQYAKLTGEINAPVKKFSNYRDLLADPSIDAVMICIPDHWHAIVATDAVLAGKHIWLQKPFTQTIEEGRILADLCKKYNRVVQVAAWQRSRPQFGLVCELVRNGRIGEIKRVEVGIGLDREGGSSAPQKVPETFDYDMWLGPTAADVPYNETRCHTQNLKNIGSRPGWIQLAPYGWGMITNWGAHHLDVTAWALGEDPTAVRGTCAWMDQSQNRLWNVHTTYDLHYTCKGADIHVNDRFQMGVKFIGDSGEWLWCTRGAMKVTPSDPEPRVRPGQLGPIAASKPSLMEAMTNPAIPLLTAKDHFLNWLEAVRAADPTRAVTTAEGGHRSTAFCSLGRMCMELSRGKKDGASLTWDAAREISGSAEANALLKPFARGKYDLRRSLAAAGLDYDKMIKPLA